MITHNHSACRGSEIEVKWILRIEFPASIMKNDGHLSSGHVPSSPMLLETGQVAREKSCESGSRISLSTSFRQGQKHTYMMLGYLD